MFKISINCNSLFDIQAFDWQEFLEDPIPEAEVDNERVISDSDEEYDTSESESDQVKIDV
jgi:hypothetical protein